MRVLHFIFKIEITNAPALSFLGWPLCGSNVPFLHKSQMLYLEFSNDKNETLF